MKGAGQEGRRMFMRGSRLYSPPNSYESSSVLSVFRAIHFQFNIDAFAMLVSSPFPILSLSLSNVSPFFNTRLFALISILLKASSRHDWRRETRPVLKYGWQFLMYKSTRLVTRLRGSWWVSWIRRYCIMHKSSTTKNAVGHVLLCA